MVRAAIELPVLSVGSPLGGTVGVGTLLYAVAIGPCTQLLLPVLVFRPPPTPHKPSAAPGTSETLCGDPVCGEPAICPAHRRVVRWWRRG